MGKNTTKYWLYGGLVALLGASAYGVSRLMQKVKDITILPNGTHSFKTTGKLWQFSANIEFLQNVRFQNPSDSSLSVKLKQIKVFRGQHQIASTVPTQNDFTIPARGTYDVNNIRVVIPQTSIGDLSSLLLDALNTKNTNGILSQLSLQVLVSLDGHDVDKLIPLGGGKPVAGLGLVAAYNRPLRNGEKFNHLFPSPVKTDNIVMSDGNVEDTVRIMLSMVDKYKDETKAFAKFIKGKSTYDTAKRLWAFMYHHIQYKPDKEGVEQLRTPARVWADRNEGVDCDCYSNFIASTLANLDIPFSFRITKYGGKSYFQHVYVVIPQKKGEILIDVVLDKFNEEKPYSDHKDFKYKK